MSDERKAKDPGAIWRNQPEEKVEMNVEYFIKRRSRELHSRTRSEIIMSIIAAVFLFVTISWWFAPIQNRFQQVALAIVIVWVLYSTYRFRDQIWGHSPPHMDAFAATGLDYYRTELVDRRDHLRNTWLWHGPTILALLILLLTIAGKALPHFARLQNMLPFVILLAVWVGADWRLRRRQANQIQREIDEIDRQEKPPRSSG